MVLKLVVLKLLLVILPLGLDTFAVSAALGAGGLPRRERLRVGLTMSAFELTMPLVGVALGRGLGAAVGGLADYLAGGCLIAVALYLLVADEGAEEATALSFSTRRGLALLALGVSVSIDELAMGFGIGLLGLSLWLAVILIGVQAFAAAQLGLRLGARLGAAARAWAERLAALGLLALGILILLEKLAR